MQHLASVDAAAESDRDSEYDNSGAHTDSDPDHMYRRITHVTKTNILSIKLKALARVILIAKTHMRTPLRDRGRNVVNELYKKHCVLPYEMGPKAVRR